MTSVGTSEALTLPLFTWRGRPTSKSEVIAFSQIPFSTSSDSSLHSLDDFVKRVTGLAGVSSLGDFTLELNESLRMFPLIFSNLGLTSIIEENEADSNLFQPRPIIMILDVRLLSSSFCLGLQLSVFSLSQSLDPPLRTTNSLRSSVNL